MMNSRRMRWAGHVARMGEKRNAYRILMGKPQTKQPLGSLGVDGRVILKWILEKSDGVEWPGFIWLRLGISGWLL
jgi:hypothetical protein